MTPILQSALPAAPWMDPRSWRLPGVQPAEPDDWLRIDDAFAGQMAARDDLIARVPQAVHALLDTARPAAAELYGMVLDRLAAMPGYRIGAGQVRRPDGVTVPLDPGAPLLTLGRLVQEDLCLLESDGTESVLTGAILCFPASWTLAQKIGRPMTRIHEPVEPYTDSVARSVQRMMDVVRPGQVLWRANALIYDDPTLHQPRPEGTHRPRPVERVFLRSERQCFVRLPQTRAVVFTIHTTVVRVADLDPAARDGLDAAGL